MKRIFGLLLTAVTLATGAQSLTGTDWNDGRASFKVLGKGNTLHFEGGTPHEGGYAFDLKQSTFTDGYILRSVYDGYTSLAGQSPEGTQAERRKIDGHDVIVFFTTTGDVTDVLVPTLKNLYDTQVDNYNSSYEGEYTIAGRKGETVTFDGNGRINIGGKWHTYKTLQCYDMPMNVFEVTGSSGEKTVYRCLPTDNGLRLSAVTLPKGVTWVPDEEERPDFDSGRQFTLLKTKSVKYALNGNWPIASKEPLTVGYLLNYDSSTLRLMRNEIFARHGFRFNDPQLAAHFSACLWYKPVTDDVNAITLSPIEKLNISLIRHSEILKRALEGDPGEG